MFRCDLSCDGVHRLDALSMVDKQIYRELHCVMLRADAPRELVDMRNSLTAESDHDALMARFVSCWQFISSHLREYELPPPVSSETQKTLTSTVMEQLFARSYQDEKRWPIGGQSILYGVFGVGKTTMLKVCGLVCSVLFTNTVVVFVDYSSMKGFESLQILMEKEFRQYPNFNDWSEARWLLLIDEFTDLYTQMGGDERLREIQNLAKNCPSVTVMMTSSVTNVDKYYYPQANRFPANNWFPTLNHRVFLKFQISAQRSPNLVYEFVAKRYNLSKPDISSRVTNYVDKNVSEWSEKEIGEVILHFTGGIAAIIDTMMTTCCFAQIGDNTAAIISNPCLLELASKFLFRYNRADLAKGVLPVLSVQLQEVKDMITKYHHSVLNAVHSYCDSMILYMDADTISFLRPRDVLLYSQLLETSELHRKLHELSLTLDGIEGVTPWLGNELIPDLLYDKHKCTRCCKTTLVLDMQGRAAWDGGAQITDVKELVGSLLRCRTDDTESGLDRICLFEDEVAGTFRVEAVQLKFGKIDQIITQGSLETQRRHGRAAKRGTHVKIDDTTIAGILVKADHEFMRLIDGLVKCFPRNTFVPSYLTIYTTKSIGRQVTDTCGAFRMDRPVAAANDPPVPLTSTLSDPTATSPSGALFQWELLYGTEWLRNLLPCDLKKLLPLEKIP